MQVSSECTIFQCGNYYIIIMQVVVVFCLVLHSITLSKKNLPRDCGMPLYNY